MTSTTPTPTKRRAQDLAFDRIESLICKLQIAPGSTVVESEIIDMTQLGRTPVREALMRLTALGLIEQQPRRGLRVSSINVVEHLHLIEARRALERLIASSSAKRASASQRKELVRCAEKMIKAAASGNIDHYMTADQALDHVNHAACGNPWAVQAVVPMVVQCRRFWYRYQAEGEMTEGARFHMAMAQAIASGNESDAATSASQLMDYLERFARQVINA